MKRIKIIGFAILFLTVFTNCKEQKNNTSKKPNIVIILADDQGWGDLSLNGNPLVNSPNIDELATQGVVLNNFYVNSVCSPTRAELLTGRYHVRGGVYSTSEGGERLDLDENTIAEAFNTAGYNTGAFGKWHNGMQPPYHPNARGFDEFYGYCSGHWGSYFDAILENNGKIVHSKGYLTDVLTSKAIDFISENVNHPFLTFLPLNTPHSPMQVPDKWFDKFKNVTLPKHRYSEKENIEKTKALGIDAEEANIFAEDIGQNIELSDIGYLMALTGSKEVNMHAIDRFKKQLGENGAFRLITQEELKNSDNINTSETLFSTKDDYINLVEVARNYPKINEVTLKSKEHFLGEIAVLNDEKNAVPLFIKDDKDELHIISAINDHLEIENDYQLVYLGKPRELMN